MCCGTGLWCSLADYVGSQWTSNASYRFQLFPFAVRQSAKLQFCRFNARRQCIFRLSRILRTDTGEQISATSGAHGLCLPHAPVHSCRSPDNTVFGWTHLSGQRQTLGLAYSVQLLTLLCCRTQPLKLPGMMLYKHLHWYGSKHVCLSVTPIGRGPY